MDRYRDCTGNCGASKNDTVSGFDLAKVDFDADLERLGLVFSPQSSQYRAYVVDLALNLGTIVGWGMKGILAGTACVVTCQEVHLGLQP